MSLTVSDKLLLINDNECDYPYCRRRLIRSQGVVPSWNRRQKDAITDSINNLKASSSKKFFSKNVTLGASSSSSAATNTNSCRDDMDKMKFTRRVSCKLSENPLSTFGFIGCALIALLCMTRWCIRYRNSRTNKSSRRYLEMSEYAAIASEYDELLEGVFETDEFTQYQEDDEDGNSIGSILTEWSGDHGAELLRETSESDTVTAFDIHLDGDFAMSQERKSGRIKIV